MALTTGEQPGLAQKVSEEQESFGGFGELTEQQRKKRLAWPDVAKGISIIGVVLLHVCLAVPDAMNTRAAALNHVLDPLRMPLFFLVSGLFSGKVLKLTFPQLFRRRLWFFLVPYMLWTPFEQYLKFVEYRAAFGADLPGADVYLFNLFAVQNMYWFLPVLIAFNVYIWATKTLPRWLVIALSFSPMLVLPLNSAVDTVGKFVMYLPVFVLGTHFSAQLKQFADNWKQPGVVVAAVSLYVVGFAGYAMWTLYSAPGLGPVTWLIPGWHASANDVWTIVRTVGQLCMVPLAVLGAVAISHIPYISQFLQFIGRHTLPVYIGHPIALTIFLGYPRAWLNTPEIALNPEAWFGYTGVWMCLGMAVAAFGGLAIWALARLPGIGWTITPPPLKHS